MKFPQKITYPKLLIVSFKYHSSTRKHASASRHSDRKQPSAPSKDPNDSTSYQGNRNRMEMPPNGNIYTDIEPVRPTKPVSGNQHSLTITENDLYSSDHAVNGRRDSAGVFIVENTAYGST